MKFMIQYIANTTFSISMIIYTSIYLALVIYLLNILNFNTVIISPMYLEPNYTNHTIFFAPCFIDNTLFELFNNLSNNYILTSTNDLYYYYLNTDYCKEIQNTSLIDAINNINDIMSNKLYLQIDYNFTNTRIIVIAIIFFIIYTCLCISIWYTYFKPKSWFHMICFVGIIIYVLLFSITFLIGQKSLITYSNFDYISNYLHVQSPNLYLSLMIISSIMFIPISGFIIIILLIAFYLLKHYKIKDDTYYHY